MRRRIRDSFLPPGNHLLAGKLNTYLKSTGAFVSTYQNRYTATSVYPETRESTWDVLHPGPPYVSGGNFASIKIATPHFNVQDVGKYPVSWPNPTWFRQYDGGFFDPLWPGTIESLTESDYYSLAPDTPDSILMPDLDPIGALAYSKLRPSVEKAGLGVALAEARDLPRMLQGSAKVFSDSWRTMAFSTSWRGARGNQYNPMRPKRLADDFVNHHFGWVPFLSDMHRFADTFQHARKYMSQISADNSKWVRRRRADEKLESEAVVYSRTDISGCQPSNGGDYSGITVGPMRFTIKLQELTEVWYEGVFKYYRPEFDDSLASNHSRWAAVQRMITLYGANVNPIVIWRATPWSWSIDWFSRAGANIQLAQDMATDAVVSKYMYLMHHLIRRFEIRSEFTTADGRSHDLVWYRYADVKRRQRAHSSFDFSLSLALTPKQIAILAALGISRVSPG